MNNTDKIMQLLAKIQTRREIMQELVRANIKDRNKIRELEATKWTQNKLNNGVTSPPNG